MPTQASADLALRFERSGGEYHVREVDGSATASFAAGEVLPFLPEGGLKRSPASLTPQDAKSLGKQLFAAIFQYELLALLMSSRSPERALRLRLDLEGTPELDDLPWELLADPKSADSFSILRYIPSPGHPLEPAPAKPLRVLVVLASPIDLPPFDIAQKWEDLELSLQDLIASGHLCCERLKEASEAGLRNALAQGHFHVLHFVGYGRSNVRGRYGSLFLEGQAQRSRAINADYLAGILDQHPATRFAVLDASGNTAELNPFAETARVLVRQGLNSVIAMRRRLSSAASVMFYQSLYSSLASGLAIDQSVTNTRKALAQRTLEVEWDVPVLYTSSGDGVLLRAEEPLESRRKTRDLERVRRPPPAPQPENASPVETPPPVSVPTQLDRRRVRRTKILLLAASPEDLAGLRLGEEFREIDAGLRRAKYRQRFQLEHRLAVRPLDLHQAMLDVEPQIVHFCGHGAGADGLILEDNNGLARPVPSAALANLFRLFSDKVECVVLNSCHTEDQAKAISEHIRYVVGMKREIEDRAAINFAIGFYCALGAGHTIDFAYESGRSAIELDDLPGNLTPDLLVRSESTGG